MKLLATSLAFLVFSFLFFILFGFMAVLIGIAFKIIIPTQILAIAAFVMGVFVVLYQG